MSAKPLILIIRRYWWMWALLLIVIGVPVQIICDLEAKSKGVLWCVLICVPPVLNQLLGIVVGMRNKTALSSLEGVSDGAEFIHSLVRDDDYVKPDEYIEGPSDGRLAFASTMSGLKRKSSGVWCVYSTQSCGRLTLLLHSVPKFIADSMYIFRNPEQKGVRSRIVGLSSNFRNGLTVVMRFDGFMGIATLQQWHMTAKEIVDAVRQEGLTIRIVLVVTIYERLDLKNSYYIRPLDRHAELLFLSALSNRRGDDVYKKACEHYGIKLGVWFYDRFTLSS